MLNANTRKNRRRRESTEHKLSGAECFYCSPALPTHGIGDSKKIIGEKEPRDTMKCKAGELSRDLKGRSS